MSEDELPTFYGEDKEAPALVPPGDEFLSTQTIDLDGLFPGTLTASGSLDLRGVTETTLAKLWEFLPLSILLVDDSGVITYANRFATNLLGKQRPLVEKPFKTLFSHSVGPRKISQLLDNVRTHRKPLVVEGTLEGAKTRIWGRTHLSSLRFMGQQFVVICLEDLTAERTGVLLTEKYKKLVQVFPIGIAEFALVPPVRAASAAEKLLRAVSEARLIGGNHEFATMNDFEGIQEAKGVFLCKVFPCEGDSADLYRAWISDGFSLKCFETRELSPTGSPAYFENTVVGNVESGFLVGIWAMRRNVTERKILEEALRDESEKLAAYSQSLESQVRDRTSHLEASQRSLEDYARKLEAANEALRVLIDGVERQKKDRERRLIDAFKFVAKPLLDQVRAQGLPRETLNMIDSLEAGLEKVVSSWSSDRVKNWELLTLREIRICEMIASGLTSKEIARIMGVSPQTIFCHRTNIRKKLGLSGTEDQLASRLRNPGR